MTMTDDSRSTYLAEAKAEAPPVIPPCPSWCISTAELRPFDFDVEAGVYIRTTRRTAATSSAWKRSRAATATAAR